MLENSLDLLGNRHYLSNDVAGLEETYGLNILLHCAVIIAFAIEVVSILPVDVSDTRFVKFLRRSKVECQEVQ
jgi:hypothetical protein